MEHFNQESSKSLDVPKSEKLTPGGDEDMGIYDVTPSSDEHPTGTSLLPTPTTQILCIDTPPAKDSRMPCMMMMLQKRLQLLPVFTAIFILTSFLISYGLAVYNKSVEPFFPYISYTAVKAPERCVFAQLVNFGAFLLAANMYVRYKQMNQVMKLLERGLPRFRRVNKWGLAMGLLSCIGLTVVANFQVRLTVVNEFPPFENVTHISVLSKPDERIQTIVMQPGHYTGAGLAFFFGTVYCWMQCWLSAKISERRWATTAVLQLINSAMLTCCLITFVVAKIYYRLEERGRDTEYTRWGKLRAAYLTSTIFEWLTALCVVAFALTFYKDFSRVNLKSPTVEIIKPDDVREDYYCQQLSSRDPESLPSTQNVSTPNSTHDHVV